MSGIGHCLAEAAAVKIASGSQQGTINPISHRIARSLSVSDHRIGHPDFLYPHPRLIVPVFSAARHRAPDDTADVRTVIDAGLWSVLASQFGLASVSSARARNLSRV